MSTDSTELTFVRCPSCRSLVPAISTRCRMCGATLEASAAPAEGGDAETKKSGRVRQRTMSESSSELSSAAEQVREAPPVVETPAPSPAFVAPTPAPVAIAKPAAEEASLEDPLSDYIEEVELKEGNGAGPVDHEEEKEVPPAPKKSAPQPQSARPAFDDDDDDTEDEGDPFGAEEEDEVEAPPAKPEPRVIVESGARKQGDSSRLAFGKSRDAEPSEPEPRVAKSNEQPERPKQPQQQQAKPAPQQPPRNEPRPQQQQQQQAKAAQQPTPRNEPRPQQQQSQPQAQQSRPQQQRQPEPRKEERQQPAPAREDRQPARAPVPFHPAAAQSEASAGRLFGWLVNYNDPSGAAVEIREGKFFVSSKSIKPSDLVIDDKTLSAPHALLVVAPGAGLLVQDLMSERGVFVRKKGSDTYKREEESVAITHGDWVRFGDVEFLVSLIAHPGEA